jgi:hypothetical protein
VEGNLVIIEVEFMDLQESVPKIHVQLLSKNKRKETSRWRIEY